MGSTVYINKPKGESLQLFNTTGVALVKDEFVVMAGKALVADEAIASAAQGGLANVDGMEIQAADFVTNEGTFGTANLEIYWDPTTKKFSHLLTVGYYLVGYTVAPLASGVVSFVAIQPVLQASDVSALQTIVTAITSLSGRPFRKTVKLTSALATTALHVVAAADVTGTNKIFVTDILANVAGADAWVGTGTVVKLQDTAGTPVVAASFAKAQLTNAAVLGKTSTGVTLGDSIKKGTGLTAAKGLDLVADGTFETSGSDLYVTVVGFIAAA